MDENAFRTYLKRAGKKDHVADELVRQMARFEQFLARCGKEPDSAEAQDLQDYATLFQPNDLKVKVRGIALYYRFTGNSELASLAHALREKETAKIRKVFKLGEFRGVNPEYVAKLKDTGIVNVEQLLEAGRTPDRRAGLAARTGVPIAAILELVKLSDLARIEGVKQIRARLYYDAGVDTPEKAAQWEPEDLRKMMVEFVAHTGFDGIAPLPKEIQHFVRTAREIPKIVEY